MTNLSGGGISGTEGVPQAALMLLFVDHEIQSLWEQADRAGVVVWEPRLVAWRTLVAVAFDLIRTIQPPTNPPPRWFALVQSALAAIHGVPQALDTVEVDQPQVFPGTATVRVGLLRDVQNHVKLGAQSLLGAAEEIARG